MANVNLALNFVLNTNASKRSVSIWKCTPIAPSLAIGAPHRAQLKELLTLAKNKLGLRTKAQRLFALTGTTTTAAAAVEIGLESIARIVSDAVAAAATKSKGGGGLTIAVSVGEDWIGSGAAAKSTAEAVKPKKPKKSKSAAAAGAVSVFIPNSDERWINAQIVLFATAAHDALFPASPIFIDTPQATASPVTTPAAGIAGLVFSPLAVLIASYATDPAPQPTNAAAAAAAAASDSSDSKSGLSVSAQNRSRKQIAKTMKDSRGAATAELRISKVTELYDQLLELCDVPNQTPAPPPPGLYMADLRTALTSHVVAQALSEADSLFAVLAAKLTYLDYTNLRFTITTGDFARNSSDPWPMIPYTDPRISMLCQLMRAVTTIFGGELSAVPSARLNAIVRRYRPGDVIGFHTDRKEYTDEIFGVVLQNVDSRRGLLFHRTGHPPFVAPEVAGLAMCFRGPARSEWLHGFSAGSADEYGPDVKVVRTSISFRFFSDVKHAPPYNTAYNI